MAQWSHLIWPDCQAPEAHRIGPAGVAHGMEKYMMATQAIAVASNNAQIAYDSKPSVFLRLDA